MNLYKKDYNNLYQLQDRFLSFWSPLQLPFYLTGGTALCRFYLNHRYSEDLDFFVNANSSFSKHILLIKDQLQNEFNADISKAIVAEDFARFFVEDKNTLMKVEFVNDVAYRVGTPLFYNKINIDTVANILANKLTAIIGRDEPKDVFDIVKIAENYSFNWTEMFAHAKEKAMLNELDIEQRLFSFPVSNLTNIDWLMKPIDVETFSNLLRKIADDFMREKRIHWGLVNH
jgi:predicted nucleotidyltransferase component of viral defense system